MRLQFVLAAVAAAIVTACSGDAATTSIDGPQTIAATTPASRGNDTSASSPGTSNGAVASVTITPHALTLGLGRFSTPTIAAYDAKGVVVTGKAATWRSADASIAITSDTGLVYARALGTTKVYGSIDGHTDSMTVTVVDAPATNPPPPPAPGVASFDLAITVNGAVLSGADTSGFVHVAGATVKLTRVGGITGDTLSTSIPAGSATTDANGNVSFKSLVGGSYTVEITPPSGSGYAAITSGIYRPTTSDVHMTFTLSKH